MIELPPGETLGGSNVLSASDWGGPDTVEDILSELGPFPGRGEAEKALRDLMREPQWGDFSQDCRDSVAAWLGPDTVEKWDPAHHPRGWRGRFVHGGDTTGPEPLTPSGSIKDLMSAGRPDGTGTPSDPIDVQGNMDRALVLMAQGKHVRLNQPDEVSTLVDRINDLAQKFKDNGGHLPTIDLGKLTVKGTNLFAAQSKGIPRIQMPQLTGMAREGTEAARIAGGAGKFADMVDAFKKKLVSDGIHVTDETVPASHLRATQSELDGEKVAGIARAYLRGDPFVHRMMAEPLWVTRDNYVLDGHHRWAADMVVDALDGKLGNDTPQEVRKVNMDIGAAVPYANAFADSVGLGHESVSQHGPLVQKVVYADTEKWDPARHPRGLHGRFVHIGSEVKDTLTAYTRPDGSLDPERARLHDRIVGDLLAGHHPAEHPTATFLGGGPAAGKSTVMSRAGHQDSVHIDADAIKARLPEYQQMLAAGDPRAAAFTHEESSSISKKAMRAAQAQGMNFTLDGTGNNRYEKLAQKVQDAKSHGYLASGKYVTIPTDVAVERAMARAKKTGRMVPEPVIREIHKSVSDTFAKAIKNNLFDQAELWDNSGAAPKLVGEKPLGGQWTVHDQGAWQSFLAKAGE